MTTTTSTTTTATTTAGGGEFAIDVADLTKSIAVGFWGTRKALLDGVTMRVRRGVVAGFVGLNGAGKSTTIKHLVGGCRPTSGSVRVLGADPVQAATRRRIGYMPELPYLPPTLSPAEMMRLHGTLCGVGGDDEKTGARWLDRVGLADKAKERIGGFSKGMQTRLSLALALLHEPELLVLDEPMSGLDPRGRQLVREIVREQADAQKTVFFSTHVLSDVEALCDDVVVIRAGKVVYSGTAADAVGEAKAGFAVRVRPRVGGAPPAAGRDGVRESKREGDTYVVIVDAAGDVVDAGASMKAAGFDVVSIEPLRATLEERTMALLGGGGAS